MMPLFIVNDFWKNLNDFRFIIPAGFLFSTRLPVRVFKKNQGLCASKFLSTWQFSGLLFTVFTLAIGFQGGEVTPLFSIGASLGVVLGSILGIPPIICGALGYAAVFGSATNTLIAPILIGLEVFGTRNTLPLILVCILAYLINGNHSIYGAQQKAL